MRERPILFSGAMIRAILARRKTQTRRVMNPQPEFAQYYTYRGRVTRDAEHRTWCWRNLVLDNIWDFPNGADRRTLATRCPYGKPGDRLWVRENLIRPDGDPWLYAADSLPVMVAKEDETAMFAWAHHKQQKYCPSIHMPRWASRITLEITEVRVQRLQEISEEDARAEGVEAPVTGESDWGEPAEAVYEFMRLWDSMNGKREGCSADSNPWVWAVSFRCMHADGGKA